MSELGRTSFPSSSPFSLLPGCSRLTSWSIAWTRWKRSASWRGTSLWSWKMILKTDPKRSRCWSWSGKMRWWRQKSRSYSPSFRYKSSLLPLKSKLTHSPVTVQEVLAETSACKAATSTSAKSGQTEGCLYSSQLPGVLPAQTHAWGGVLQK